MQLKLCQSVALLIFCIGKILEGNFKHFVLQNDSCQNF